MRDRMEELLADARLLSAAAGGVDDPAEIVRLVGLARGALAEAERELRSALRPSERCKFGITVKATLRKLGPRVRRKVVAQLDGKVKGRGAGGRRQQAIGKKPGDSG